jgi:hypothetical protein
MIFCLSAASTIAVADFTKSSLDLSEDSTVKLLTQRLIASARGEQVPLNLILIEIYNSTPQNAFPIFAPRVNT